MAKKKKPKPKKKVGRKPAAKRRPKGPVRRKIARRRKGPKPPIRPPKKVVILVGGVGPPQPAKGQAPHNFTRFKLINNEPVRQSSVIAASHQPFTQPSGGPPALSLAKPIATGANPLPFGQSREQMINGIVDAKSVKFTMAVRDGTTQLPARCAFLQHQPTGWPGFADIAEIEVTYTAVNVTPGAETYTIDVKVWWYDLTDTLQLAATQTIVMTTI